MNNGSTSVGVHPAISNPRLLQLSVFILMMNSQIYYFHNTLFSVNWQLVRMKTEKCQPEVLERMDGPGAEQR